MQQEGERLTKLGTQIFKQLTRLHTDRGAYININYLGLKVQKVFKSIRRVYKSVGKVDKRVGKVYRSVGMVYKSLNIYNKINITPLHCRFLPIPGVSGMYPLRQVRNYCIALYNTKQKHKKEVALWLARQVSTTFSLSTHTQCGRNQSSWLKQPVVSPVKTNLTPRSREMCQSHEILSSMVTSALATVPSTTECGQGHFFFAKQFQCAE